MSTKRKPVVTIYEDELPDLYKIIVQKYEEQIVKSYKLEKELANTRQILNTRQRILLN